VGNTPTLAGSTVLYLFSTSVACADISAPGWDNKASGSPAAGTKVLELSVGSKSTGTYTVASAIATGGASAAYNVTPAGATADDVGTSGTVTLATYSAGTSISGCFDVTLTTNGHVSGTFDATWCPSGTEP
jgi:hypothetical protein